MKYKKYSSTPLQVRLHNYQEYALNELISDEDFCQRKHFYSKSDILRNQLNTNKLQIVTTNGTVVRDNAGSYNTANGTVNIRGVTFDAYEGSAIKVSALPANQSTIKPLRNYILSIDSALSIAQGVIDYQETEITL